MENAVAAVFLSAPVVIFQARGWARLIIFYFLNSQTDHQTQWTEIAFEGSSTRTITGTASEFTFITNHSTHLRPRGARDGWRHWAGRPIVCGPSAAAPSSRRSTVATAFAFAGDCRAGGGAFDLSSSSFWNSFAFALLSGNGIHLFSHRTLPSRPRNCFNLVSFVCNNFHTLHFFFLLFLSKPDENRVREFSEYRDWSTEGLGLTMCV